MICIYCENSCEAFTAGIYECTKCPIKVTFICSGSMFHPEIYYTQFIFEKYLIELKICDDAAGLYSTPNGPFARAKEHYDVKTIKLFDYVPDITPTTAEAWMNRIFNLKAFL